jgi:BlaI family transcriptional regulator, penicillinase repressor
MARPKKQHPTEAELDVLHVLWEDGPSSVRHVMEALARKKPRAYTSVMSLMTVMANKGLLKRAPEGRAFVYAANVKRDQALGGMVADLLQRGFRGSASALVAHLIGRTSRAELDEIRRTIDAYKAKGGP